MADTCFWFDEVGCIETCLEGSGIPPYGDFIQRAELTGPGGIDHFGRFVAIDGNTAMISVDKIPGAFPGDESGANNTVVYSNVDGTWTEGQTLSESQTMMVQDVIDDTAIFTTYRVTSTEFDTYLTAGVYVYRKTGGIWNQVQHLEASNPLEQNIFSSTAALSPDRQWLAMGVTNQTTGATSVLMYEWSGSGFVYHSEIISPDSLNDQFGDSIGLSSEGVMVVGAPGADGGGSNDGAAYIYALSGSSWSLIQTIYPTVNESATRFGYDASISSDATALVVGDQSSGASIYEFDGSTYSYVERRDPGGINGSLTFISDDGLTVIQNTNPLGTDSSAYVYQYDAEEPEWYLSQTITPDHPDLATEWIGIYGIHLRNGYLIAGSAVHESNDGLVDGPGYVYIYSRDPIA